MKFRGFYQGPAWKWNLWFRWVGYHRIVLHHINVSSRPFKAVFKIDTSPNIYHSIVAEKELERELNENYRNG